MEKEISLDDAARQYADGHYVEQSFPGPNPDRDKRVSEALQKMKREYPDYEDRQ